MSDSMLTAGSTLSSEAISGIDWGNTSGEKSSVSETALRTSLDEAIKSGGKSEEFATYLSEGHTRYLDNDGISKRLNTYFAKLAESSPDVLREFTTNNIYANYTRNKTNGDRNKREAAIALRQFVSAENEEARKDIFNRDLLRYFQKQDGSYHPQSPMVSLIEKEPALKPIVSAAKNLGLLQLVDNATNTTKVADNPNKQIQDDVYEKAIDFDMRELEHIFNPDTGNIERNGEVLVRSINVGPEKIRDLGLDPNDPESPVKAGPLNWYSFVKDMKTLAMAGDKEKFANHVVNKLSLFNAVYREDIAKARADGEHTRAELLTKEAKDVVRVFRDGFGSVPKEVTDLVRLAFEEKSNLSKDANRILSGKASKAAGTKTISKLVEEIEKDTTGSKSVPGYQGNSDSVGNTKGLKDLVVSTEDNKISIFDAQTLGNRAVDVVRSEKDNGESADEYCFTRAAKEHEDALGSFSTAFTDKFKTKVLGVKAGTVTTEAVKDFNETVQTQMNRFRTADSTDRTEKQRLKQARNITQKLIEEFVNSNEIKGEQNEDAVGKVAEEFVRSLVSQSGMNASTEAIDHAFQDQIAALSNLLTQKSVSTTFKYTDHAGEYDYTGDLAVKALIKDITTMVTENSSIVKAKTTDADGDEVDTYKLKADTSSNGSTQRSKKVVDYLVGNAQGLKLSLLDKVVADPSATDMFSKINFAAIGETIEGSEALKDRLMSDAPHDIENFGEYKKHNLRAGPRAAVLFGAEQHIKKESARNAAQLIEFADLLRAERFTRAQVKDVAKSLFRGVIKGDDERARAADLERYTNSLYDFINESGTGKFEVLGGDKTTERKYGLEEMADMTGRLATRAATLRQAGDIVDRKEAGIESGRATALIDAFSPKSIEDQAENAERIATGLEAISDSRPESLDELFTEMNEKIGGDAITEFKKWIGGDPSMLTTDGDGKINETNAQTVINKAKAFFKSLASKLGLVKFAGTQQSYQGHSATESSGSSSSSTSTASSTPAKPKEEDAGVSNPAEPDAHS